MQGNSSASADDFEKGVFPTGTLHFAAGAKEPSQPLVINVVGDITVEDDESFTLELLNPVGATLNADMVSGTILNDDVPPDLIVSKIESTTVTVEKGQSFNYVYTIENIGKGDAPISGAGIYLDGKKLSGADGWDEISAIAAGGTSKEINTIDTSLLDAGKHTFVVKANDSVAFDAGLGGLLNKNIPEIAESNSDNNEQLFSFEVKPLPKAIDIFTSQLSTEEKQIAGAAENAGMIRVMADFSKAAYFLPDWEKDTSYNDISDNADTALDALLNTQKWKPLDLSIPSLTSGTFKLVTDHTLLNTTVDCLAINKMKEGYYTNNNAAALVACSSDAIVISFRGTNDNRAGDSDSGIINPLDLKNDISPDEDQWTNMSGHYDLFRPLVNSLKM